MKWKILLRDFVVTVGLLAMTLLSFMSKRVVPMGTSWYLPYCVSVGVGIMSLLCVVLLWDSIKAGKTKVWPAVIAGHRFRVIAIRYTCDILEQGQNHRA